MTLYTVLKSLHVLGVVVFLGNIIVTGWWKFMADRTGDPRVIAFAQRQVTQTDWVFTFLGSALLVGSGFAAALSAGFEIFTRPWIGSGLALLTLSALIWVAVLVPVQSRQTELARQFADGGDIPEEYRRLCRRWNTYGTLATLLPVAALFVMVLKPA